VGDIEEYHCHQLHTKFYVIFFSQGYLCTQTELLGIISVDFDITDQLMIIYSAFIRYWRREWEYMGIVQQLFTDFKKAYDSVKEVVLYNSLIEFGIL
jgi:hypothetical protein